MSASGGGQQLPWDPQRHHSSLVLPAVNFHAPTEFKHELVDDGKAEVVPLFWTVWQIEREIDGDRALEMFQADPNIVDFVVCDWMMPNMSGLELLKRVRELNSDIPFLMLTAKSTIDAVKSAMDAGVNQNLTKPFTPDDLQKRVRAMTKELIK